MWATPSHYCAKRVSLDAESRWTQSAAGRAVPYILKKYAD
jgi:hypothetical protein